MIGGLHPGSDWLYFLFGTYIIHLFVNHTRSKDKSPLRRNRMKTGETGGKLAELIKKAIDDGELSNSEYDRILALADADGMIDSQEKNLLKQLQELLANKTIKRVPD
jgi:hypothetical protein